METTFRDVTQSFINGLGSAFGHRSNDPLSENTQKLYRHSASRAASYLGDVPLTDINAGHIKGYISQLKSERLKPTSVNLHFQVLKAVVESVRDQFGDPVKPLKVNLNFVGLPSIKLDRLKAPIASIEDVEKGVAVGGELGALVALCAGSGLRVSEACSLTIDGKNNHYDTATGSIVIKTGKTDSAARVIPLDPRLNSLLLKMAAGRSGKLFTTPHWTLRRQLEGLGLPPFHSYRRFRATHLRRASMVEEIVKYLLGHSRGNDITNRYSRLTADVDFIQNEVRRVGLGFSLGDIN